MSAMRNISIEVLFKAAQSVVTNWPTAYFDRIIIEQLEEYFNIKISINYEKTTWEDDCYMMYDVEFQSEAEADSFLLKWSNDPQLFFVFWP